MMETITLGSGVQKDRDAAEGYNTEQTEANTKAIGSMIKPTAKADSFKATEMCSKENGNMERQMAGVYIATKMGRRIQGLGKMTISRGWEWRSEATRPSLRGTM